MELSGARSPVLHTGRGKRAEVRAQRAAAKSKSTFMPPLLRLNLTMQKLLVVPAAVCKLDSLVELSVVANRICELPAQLGQCWRLRVLNAGANELCALPVLSETTLVHVGLVRPRRAARESVLAACCLGCAASESRGSRPRVVSRPFAAR